MRRHRWVGAAAVVTCILVAAGCASASAPRSGSPTLLAVFAHPDDELTVAPVLSRYAREGARVYLAIATGGEAGVSRHARIPAGPRLAATRADEARCACAALGIESPILLGFTDGSLATESTLHALADAVRALFERYRPDAVITWGPEGGYGHPDHRLVGAVVTQVVQGSGDGVPRSLYFPGFSPAQLAAHGGPSGLPWIPVPADLLTVRVGYEPRDLEATRAVFACHATQFPADRVDRLAESMGDRLGGRVSFRPWLGLASGDELAGDLPE